jgi:hypothetical protein
MSDHHTDIRIKLNQILRYGRRRAIIAVEESIEAIHAQEGIPAQLAPDGDWPDEMVENLCLAAFEPADTQQLK